jgi:predicted lipid-binding transport protein (Tim44 family)
MRFSLIDVMVDQDTGRVIDGSRTEPQEVTEVWTFVRQSAGRSGRAGSWELSAIQQA